MFLIAHLTIEELSNKSLDWLRDKHTNAYFKIVDFLSPNYSTDQDKIYELYKIAYEETARIEGHGLLLDDKNKLIDYNKWVIITDSSVKVVKDSASIYIIGVDDYWESSCSITTACKNLDNNSARIIQSAHLTAYENDEYEIVEHEMSMSIFPL
ncbi:hypothetical protein MCHI_002233 [Candidatus Magnetoovum chiemensis]|nr:hypothetical protein MCHI_002233 [Candidatus Magnetoovum chiemensis]